MGKNITHFVPSYGDQEPFFCTESVEMATVVLHQLSTTAAHNSSVKDWYEGRVNKYRPVQIGVDKLQAKRSKELQIFSGYISHSVGDRNIWSYHANVLWFFMKKRRG